MGISRDDLNPQQLAAITDKSPVLLVRGGPGSGKTATALFAGREAILDGELASDQYVLYLTFSRTAVNQIIRRAPRVMEESHGRIEVHTFHGLAYRLLRAFGRYNGLGLSPVRLQSESARKLLGREPGTAVYDDLMPAALQVLRRPAFGGLIRRRWPLVICDEFQDTGDDQWELILHMKESARTIFLADPDQMIYDFLGDVRPERLEEAQAMASRVIDLPEVSFRDPSGTIPAVARAVMRREFDHPAIQFAIDAQRLKVLANVEPQDVPDIAAREVAWFREQGCKTIGIYTLNNDRTTQLSADLARMKINHVIIGVPESHSEGISTILTMLEFAAGQATIEDLTRSLGTFMVSYSRGKPSLLARQLAGQLPRAAVLEHTLEQFRAALSEAGTGSVREALAVVRPFWRQTFTRGTRIWNRSYASVIAACEDLSGRQLTPETVRILRERTDPARSASLVRESDEGRLSGLQLMNMYQTKGREADGIIISVQDDDIFGEDPPYPQKSRVLFVAISRARSWVTILLPPHVHELVAPLLKYAEA